ncbi:MAG: preprotein translocase subunit SecE [Verrucomicrobiales bacterium]
MPNISKYLTEVKVELQKATWPWDPKEKGFKKFRELTDSTVVVLVAMLLLGAFVAFWDLILNAVSRALTF